MFDLSLRQHIGNLETHWESVADDTLGEADAQHVVVSRGDEPLVLGADAPEVLDLVGFFVGQTVAEERAQSLQISVVVGVFLVDLPVA